MAAGKGFYFERRIKIMKKKRILYAILWFLIGISAIMTIPDEPAIIYADEALDVTHSAEVLSR